MIIPFFSTTFVPLIPFPKISSTSKQPFFIFLRYAYFCPLVKRIVYIGLVLIGLAIASCNSASSEFKPNQTAQLTEYGLLSPFYIEQLTESPIRQFHGWNDSLLKLTKIKSIKVIAHGMKNPDAEAELSSFHFNTHGKINQFRYFKYELGQDPFIQVNFTAQGGKISTYFGQKVNQLIQIESANDRYKQLWKRENGADELLQIIGSTDKPQLLLSYSGVRLSKVTVVINNKNPLQSIIRILEEHNITKEDLVFAEKAVLYVDDKYQPVEMYQFNDEFVQEALLAEWIYEKHKKLTGYRRYINGTLVKEFTFTYSDDRLMNGFEYNRVRYSVHYN